MATTIVLIIQTYIGIHIKGSRSIPHNTRQTRLEEIQALSMLILSLKMPSNSQ